MPVTWDDIHRKKKEIEVAETFFNNCDLELFEMANLKLTALEMELVLLQKQMRQEAFEQFKSIDNSK